MNATRIDSLVWVVLGLGVALFLGWAAAPASGLYARLLGPHQLLAIGAALKLLYLFAGTAWAFACRDRLEAGNPARAAWFLLSLGLLSNFLAQLCLSPFQLMRGETPFPSVADLYFILAYPFLIAAFLIVLHAYREAGFPIGSVAERTAIVAAVGIFGAVVAVPILRPVTESGAPPLELVLTVAYPVLDLILLIPLALLLRIAFRLGGSRVGRVWLLLLGGFAVMCLGDISFAYTQSLGYAHLDPLVHASFLLSYGLVAGGARRQLRLLTS